MQLSPTERTDESGNSVCPVLRAFPPHRRWRARAAASRQRCASVIPAQLQRLAQLAGLDRESRFDLRIRFGLACIERIEHLLSDEQVLAALAVGKQFARGAGGRDELEEAAGRAAAAARSHAGSNSLDGAGNAAVSTSYGVAAALAGRALQASEYAAYAAVYSYSSHAVTDLDAYRDEHDWQTRKLAELIDESAGAE